MVELTKGTRRKYHYDKKKKKWVFGDGGEYTNPKGGTVSKAKSKESLMEFTRKRISGGRYRTESEKAFERGKADMQADSAASLKEEARPTKGREGKYTVTDQKDISRAKSQMRSSSEKAEAKLREDRASSKREKKFGDVKKHSRKTKTYGDPEKGKKAATADKKVLAEKSKAGTPSSTKKKEEPKTFKQAFAQARKEGKATFKWRGKPYAAVTKDEVNKAFKAGKIKPTKNTDKAKLRAYLNMKKKKKK